METPKKHYQEIEELKPTEIITQKDREEFGLVRRGKINPLALILDPLLWRYDRLYRENKRHLIYDILLALGLLALFAVNLVLWLGPFGARPDNFNVVLQISPEPVLSGSRVTYTIKYSNKSASALHDTFLSVRIPSGFEVDEFSPKEFNIKNHTLQIGDIAPGGNGEIDLTGKILNPVGDYQKIMALISYQDNKNQSYQENFSSSYLVSDSVFHAELQFPNIILANNPFTIKVKVKNEGDADYKNIKLKINFPSNFIFTSSDLGPASGINDWQFSLIRAHEEKIFNILGGIRATEAGEAIITTGISAFSQGAYITQGRKTTSFDYGLPQFALSFGNTDQNQKILPGQEMAYKIIYENKENYVLKNVSLALELQSEFIDWAYLRKNYEVNGNQIIITKNRVKGLAEINPGEGGNLEIKIKTLAGVDLTKPSDLPVVINATIIGAFDNTLADLDYLKRIESRSDQLSTLLASVLKIRSQAIYYTLEGDQIGLGSLPPRVGETTSYWIVIRIINGSNKVNNIEVRATVPDDVVLTGNNNVTQGNPLEINQVQKVIRWQVDSAVAYAGIFFPAPEARLEVALTPVDSQAGKIVTLLKDIQIKGTDEPTGFPLQYGLDPITTDISKDNPSWGVVVK